MEIGDRKRTNITENKNQIGAKSVEKEKFSENSYEVGPWEGV